jgi:glycosyltransferase involved in cell wall biosynthesis
MTPNLSIVIPLFNKAPYIGATLQALIGQLGETDEILVVDDQSADTGAEIAQVILRDASSPGQVISLPKNSGPATARNVGAHLAKSSHLLFFDADDIPLPNMLRILRSAIEQYPSVEVFAYQIAFQARSKVAPKSPRLDTLSTSLRPLHAFSKDSLMGKALCTASSTCVSRAAFLAADGGFREDLRYCEDPELWARLSAIHPILEIHETLAIYRDVPASLSYGQRVRPGSVNPYVDSLQRLAQQHDDIYLQLAHSILLKNLVFSRAAGASRLEVSLQLNRYKHCLGWQKHLLLRCINSLPSMMFRKALGLRTSMRTKI